MSRVRVSFSRKTIDDKNIYVLTDHSKTFKSIEEAIGFIKQVRTTKDLVGSPLLESV